MQRQRILLERLHISDRPSSNHRGMRLLRIFDTGEPLRSNNSWISTIENSFNRTQKPPETTLKQHAIAHTQVHPAAGLDKTQHRNIKPTGTSNILNRHPECHPPPADRSTQSSPPRPGLTSSHTSNLTRSPPRTPKDTDRTKVDDTPEQCRHELSKRLPTPSNRPPNRKSNRT